MQSATPELRPMSIGDLLDAVFRIYRNHFLILIGISALAQIPLLLVQLGLDIVFGQRFVTDLTTITERLPFFDPSTDSFTELPLGNIATFLFGSIFLAALQAIFIQPILSGALSKAVSESYHGQKPQLLGSYNLGSSRILNLIGVGLLTSLIALVGGGAIFVLYLFGVALLISSIEAGGGSGSILLGILGIGFLFLMFVGFLIFFFAFWLRLLFATQAVVFEERGAFAALGRSWRLIRGSFWRVFGIYILMQILVQIIIGIPLGIGSFFLGVAFGSSGDPLAGFGAQQAITSLLSYGAQILVFPIQLCVLTLLYYDMRVRKEGYDLSLRAQAVAPTTEWQ